MRSLYLRIWLTVVAALALFALVSGWALQRHLDQQRQRLDGAVHERMEAWGDLMQRSLAPASAPVEEQAASLREWSQRLRLPMALEDANGRRIAASGPFLRRQLEREPNPGRLQMIPLDDGRKLWTWRPPIRPPAGAGQRPPPWAFNVLPDGVGLAALLLVLFAAIAAGAWPVVRRLTRRLEALKRGVEAFGAGQLSRRVAEDGRDEVAMLGASFNQAAGRIEALLRSHQNLLANASHELRSPLARLKMAVSMMDEAPPPQRDTLRREIDTNIAELDALVEEVLLASRLDAATASAVPREAVPVLALAAEEAARVGADAEGDNAHVQAEERLLRRAVRNLLENARRYGGDEVSVQVKQHIDVVEVIVCDRGPGVPESFRERIFEPFFRMPGHAEREGGVGLGLALVRQIAERHGGRVRCEPREGGGSRFVLSVPLG